MIRFNHQIKKELVYEGLIYTTNIDTTIDELKRWAIASDKFKLSVINNKIRVTFTITPTIKEIDNLIQNVNRLGWVITSMLMFGQEDLKWCKFDINKINNTLIALQIEAKFDIEKTIYEIDILYHVSATRRSKKILSIGLCPKAGKKINDPNFDGGAYTLSNIPPKFVKWKSEL